MNDRNPQRPLSSWIELLQHRILVADLEEATVLALCGHLADLGVLEKAGEEWRLVEYRDDALQVEEEMEQRLNQLSATEQGFALRYFLRNSLASSGSGNLPEQSVPQTEKSPKNNPQLLDQKTSNLSNLQIVKKYGRQVQSFIELEKSYTEKLLGPNTNMKSARKIFNFILSRTQDKTEPRPWEQLSRRRHK